MFDSTGVMRYGCKNLDCLGDCMHYIRPDPQDRDQYSCKFCNCGPGRHFKDPPASTFVGAETMAKETASVLPPVLTIDDALAGCSQASNNIVPEITAGEAAANAVVCTTSNPSIQVDPVPTTVISRKRPGLKGYKIPTKKRTGAKPPILNDEKNIPVPTFSKKVLLGLQSKDKEDTMRVLDKAVNESAEFYLSLGIGHGNDYAKVGAKLVGMYPHLGQPGTLPWSTFTSSLSDKIRQMRLKRNKPQQVNLDDSQLIDSSYLHHISTSRIERAKVENVDYVDSTNVMKQILDESVKKYPSDDIVRDLLNKTYSHRSFLLQKGFKADVVLDLYPILEKSEWLLFEAGLLYSSEKVKLMERNIRAFMKAVKLEEKVDNENLALEMYFLSLRSKTNFITFVEKSEVCRLLKPDHKLTGRLVVCTEYEKAIEIYLVGFGRCTPGIKSLEEAMLLLILQYHVLNVAFPPAVFQGLKVLEMFALGCQPEPTVGVPKYVTTYYGKLLQHLPNVDTSVSGISDEDA